MGTARVMTVVISVILSHDPPSGFEQGFVIRGSAENEPDLKQ